MLTIRPATMTDITQLLQYDRDMGATDLARIIPLGHVLMAYVGARFVGWLRYGVFRDEIPMVHRLCLLEGERGKGYGSALMADWEGRARADGRARALADAQAGEAEQGFFRKLGYRDAGLLLLPGQAADLLLVKEL